MRIQGYYPVYRIGNPTIANLPFDRLTHIAYFNIAPTATGTLVTNVGGHGDVLTNMASLVSTCHANDVKVLICIGGASAAPDTTWREAIGATYRATFVANLVDFVATWNLDGIDLDWEPFDTESDGTNFATFISDLRTALPVGKEITMFIGGTGTYQSWKRTFANTVEANIDSFGLSTYDYSYSESNAVYDSPLYHVTGQSTGSSADEATDNYLAAGVAASKLSIGVPFYGVRWTGATTIFQAVTPNNFTNVTYKEISDAGGGGSGNPPTDEVYDSVAKYSYNTTTALTTYSNEASIQAKVDYVNTNSLNGIIIWELSQAYFSAVTPSYPLMVPFIGETGTPTPDVTLLAFNLTTDFTASTTATGITTGSVTDQSGSLTSFARDTLGYVSDPVCSVGPASGAIDAATAISTNSYFFFTCTPLSGKKVNLTSLTINMARGGAATPRGYVIKSSIDNYTATLGTANLTTQRPTFQQVTIDLSGASFQSVSVPITFRIYVYAPTTVNLVEWDDIVLTGTVLDSGVVEQEGFRFRNDDGTETTATWLAAQDTNITQPKSTNTRLRVVLNSTLDRGAETYQLEYRKVGDATWLKMT